MDTNFNCPQCGQGITIDDSAAGQLVDCPKCNLSVEVPRSPEFTPPPVYEPPPPKPKTARDVVVPNYVSIRMSWEDTFSLVLKVVICSLLIAIPIGIVIGIVSFFMVGILAAMGGK